MDLTKGIMGGAPKGYRKCLMGGQKGATKKV